MLFLAGGTLLLDKASRLISVLDQDDIERWLSEMPELNILSEIEPVFIAGEDQVIGPKIWEQMAQIISKNVNQADGFVVVSRPEQIIYTSLALGFLLPNFQKSIICTSSKIGGTEWHDKKVVIAQLKNEQGGLGLRSNLINAVQVALQNVPGPAIMFGTRLIPAAKAITNFSDSANPITSCDNTYWGKVDFGVSLRLSLPKSFGSPKIFTSLSSDVLILEDLPGISWRFEKNDLLKYQAVLVKLSDSHCLDPEKIKLLISWQLPVVLYHQEQVLTHFESSVSLSDCTFYVAAVKTIWAASNFKKKADFIKAIKQNVIGEFVA